VGSSDESDICEGSNTLPYEVIIRKLRPIQGAMSRINVYREVACVVEFGKECAKRGLEASKRDSSTSSARGTRNDIFSDSKSVRTKRCGENGKFWFSIINSLFVEDPVLFEDVEQPFLCDINTHGVI
jgi:hypothetical protein